MKKKALKSLKLKKTGKFYSPRLIIIIAVFAGLGVYLIYKGLAATPGLIWEPDYASDTVKDGWQTRQGTCHAINQNTSIERTPGVPSLQYIVTPNDGQAPGTNSPPLGGCFSVDRQTNGSASASAAALLQYANGGFTEGTDVYVGVSMYIPSSQTATTNGDESGPAPPNNTFPVINNGAGWSLQLMEFYGAPYNGPSPTGLSFGPNGVIPDYNHNYVWWGGPLYNGDHIWYSPQYTYNTWHDMVFHLHFSSNTSLGFVEIWYDGARQTFRDGSQTYHYATINQADSTGPISIALQQYRWSVPYTFTTYWSADTKVGTTYAAVAPGGSSGNPPTVTLTANPTTINSGQSSTLTWSSSNATSCSATTPSGWTGSTATSGSQSVSPTTTTTYTITCTGSGGSTPASATVTVGSAQTPTVSLTANPTTTTSGQSSTLTWSSANATSCNATSPSGWTISTATSGSQGVSPTTTTTYQMTCSGPGGTSSPASATVTVNGVSSGDYSTIVNQTSNLCMDVSGSSIADGAAVQQYSCNGTGAQNWKVTTTASGYYNIVNQASGKCLYVPGGSTASGTKLQQYTCSNTGAQNWRITAAATNGYYYLVNQTSGLCVDDPNSSTSGGIQLQQYSCNGTTAQSWTGTALLDTTSTLTGDLNGDGHVNVFDLSIFLTHWQQTGTGIPEDFNNDNIVNIFDLSILLSNYGT